MLVSERYSYDMLRTEISAVKRLLLDGRQATDLRFDRVDGELAVLKDDMAETKDRLGRLERSTQAGFDRMDAKFERLIGLIERDERRA